MFRPVVLWAVVCALAVSCFGQSTGTISGTVTIESLEQPLHGAHVILTPLGRTADTGEDGTYEFRDVPPGAYEVIARRTGLFDDRKTAQVTAGGTETVDFRMRLAPVRETVTVTATGREEVTLDAVQSVVSIGQLELPLRSGSSLGDVLESEAGVAKRSFGPGSSRPVVRGFDGDRVLILEDGVRTGSLSSQSGDHGEPMDVNKLERLEVVRGPATLLYGSNAIGGVVNAVSRHDGFREHSHEGIRGYLTGVAGSSNMLGGGSGGFEFGTKKWEFWASGGGQRTSPYHTPLGELRNSQTRLNQTDAGFGRYGTRGFASFNYGFTDSRYGIPAAAEDEEEHEAEDHHHHEPADLLLRRHTFRFNGGLRNLGFLDGVTARVNYSDYNHQEIVENQAKTTLYNKQFIYRTVFDQKRRDRLSGSFGFWGMRRDYKVEGEESLAPPAIQNAFALFALESLDFEGLKIQFGGRLEHNGYTPQGLLRRSFTGFSGAAGISKRLWNNGAFVVNYSHSFRAPSVEELYNFGPHPGNLTFEIGNPNLRAERNNGVDVSLRHQSARINGELNFFYYRIHNFVYLAPTGGVADGFIEADYFQENSRFLGGEARLNVGLHPNLWLNLAADAVNARLIDSRLFLPRIPPLRGRVGFDARLKGLSVRPELAMAYAQHKLFPTETRTAGYAVMNLTGSYTIARAHDIHIFSAQLFNAGDRLYRNHLSFIKEFAPEIGRGVRFSYTVQFF
jgi:iron complex outermembrane receptor protein